MLTSWRQITFFAAVSLVAGLMMISSESLWIDEGQTLRFAWLPTLSAWGQKLWQCTKSEAQMPLGMLVAWAAEKVLGSGEWQLRAINLLWVSLGGLAMGLTGRLLRQPFLLPLFLLSPFLWLYANEARPYAMQICAAAWMLYVMVRLQTQGSPSKADVWLCAAWAVLGFGASMLFGFLFAGMLAGLWGPLRRQRGRMAWTPTHLAALATAIVLVGGLSLYYLYTLKRGASGARIWKVGLLNLGFAAYELLGLSGLGPPRGELRELARTPRLLFQQLLQPLTFVGLGSLSLFYLVMVWRGWRLRREPLVRWLTVVLLVTAGCLFVAATVVGFPFWGRHLAPLVPFLVALLGKLVSNRSEATDFWNTHKLALLLCIPLLLSSLMLRFAPWHRKDDYRAAARLALRALARGGTVWWSADHEECAVYYGLTPAKATVPGARLLLANCPSLEALDAASPPDLVFLSKPDIHDNRQYISSYLERMHYREAQRLPSFILWIKPQATLQQVIGEP